MASSKRKNCDDGRECKRAGVDICEGCSQVFCTYHFDWHRRLLGYKVDDILRQYNNFNNTISQEPTNANIQPLIKEIDDWEQDAIMKIQQKATELRHELLQLKNTHIEYLSAKLKSLDAQIKQRQDQKDFVESDLDLWKKRLDDLASNFTSRSIIKIIRHDNIPLVSTISVSFLGTDKTDVFERVFNDNVQIAEDGEAVTAIKGVNTYTEIRGKNDYEFGCHMIRLQIERLSTAWIFIGINSKSIPLQASSYSCKSAYGWCSSNYVYSGGSYEENKTKSTIELKEDDIITLVFDCENRKISMNNERTNTKHELTVDVNNCPFPWQLHVILRRQGSRVRILSA